MKAVILAMLLPLLASAVLAEVTNKPPPAVVTSNALPTTITIDGITYSNVTWRTVTPATVTIFHRTGIASIPLEKLPPELQKQFGYDTQKAKRYTDAEAEHAALEANARAERAAFEREATGKAIVLGKLVSLSGASKQTVKGWVTKKGQLRDENGDVAAQGTVIDIGITSRTPNRRIDAGPIESVGVGSRDVYLPGREITEPGGQEVLILGWLSPANIGERTEVDACLVEPRLGLKTLAVPQAVTFEWWKQHRQSE